MKRILSLVLILILSLSVLTACDMPAQLQDILASLGIGTPSVSYDLENAKTYLKDLYPNLLPTKEIPVPSTLASFNVTKVLVLADGKYSVSWSADTDSVRIVDYTPKGEDDIFSAETTSTVKVILDSEDVNYVLTATITAPNGDTAVVDFSLVIPALDCNTHDEYMAAASGVEVMVKGVVVAINSKTLGNKYNHVFLADTDVTGGYYCYSITEDPAELGVKVGMTVAVSGPITPYSGMQEIKGGQLIIIDDSIKTVEPVDITDKFTSGADLGAYVGLPVTIKGVDIGTQDLANPTSQYLWFSIGEQKGYVRTYVTDFAVGSTAEEMEALKAAIDADHAAHFGYKADATGILILYNGAPYLVPMSATPFTNYVEVVKTDAEKVASEKDTLKITTSFTADGTMTLPLVGVNYSDVAIAWTSDSEYIVIAEDGTATVKVPDTKTVVKLTATLTCGEATETVEIEVTLNKKALTAGEAAEIGSAMEHNTYTDGKYLIAGIVTEVYNDQYGNMYIKDELGNILTVYGTYSADGSTRYDAMETKPVAGDYVVLLGVLGQYNGNAQTKNAWIISWTTPTDIPSANEIGTANPSYTKDKYLVTGTVTEVANTQYGNLYIEDAEGNKLYIYGLYDQLGNRYDAMTKAPAVGDTITVLTTLGAYKNSPQGKNATLVAHTVATTDDDNTDDDTTGDDDTTTDSVLTVEQAITLGASKEHNTYTEEKYYVTGVITEVYNTTYGNMKITDEAGNVLTVYGTYSADGSTRYDAMATQPVAGDTVTVYGIIGQYNGTAQVKNGWITEHTPAGGDDTTTDPAADSVLTVEQAIALGASKEHNTYTDGKYYVIGVITEVYNTTYGNMKITDEAGNVLTVYGTYSADGSTRYDAMATQPVAGDTVTVYGIIGQYNGTAQVKNGWITGHTPAGGDDTTGDDTTGGDTPTTGTYVQVTDASQFTTGTYVLVVGGEHGLGVVDGSWISKTSSELSECSTWTLTVDGTSVTLMDANGVYVAPKGGNSNGIKTGTAYSWNWTINDDGTFTFAGTGDDTVTLAFNSDAQYLKFRGYKNTTVSGDNADTYPSTFAVYKLVD